MYLAEGTLVGSRREKMLLDVVLQIIDEQFRLVASAFLWDDDQERLLYEEMQTELYGRLTVEEREKGCHG